MGDEETLNNPLTFSNYTQTITDRLRDTMLSRSVAPRGRTDIAIRMPRSDMKWVGDNFKVDVDLPGWKKEDIAVNMTGCAPN